MTPGVLSVIVTWGWLFRDHTLGSIFTSALTQADLSWCSSLSCLHPSPGPSMFLQRSFLARL